MRIVIVSEMGGGWGHLLPLRAFAREFIRRGAEVVVLAREVKKAGEIFASLGAGIFSLPHWTSNKIGFSLNYAQCLWGNGYREDRRFHDHFFWWVERFRALVPSFVLSDFSPTALLAARAMGLPRGAIGTGFTLPPPLTPMPSLHPWLQLCQKDLTNAEEQLAAAIRRVIPDFHAAADLFTGALRFLTIFPELDHYSDRPSERYWGPVLEKIEDGEFTWPVAEGPRVFFYLNAGNRCLSRLLDHLRRLGLPVVGHVGGLPDSERQALESPTLKLYRSLVDLKQAALGADLAVTQGGVHTSAAMLLSGIPLLVCPEQLEQALLAYRLNGRGLCEWLSPWTDPERVGKRFDHLLSSTDLADNAAAFANKYGGYDPVAMVQEVVRACLEAAA